MDFKNFVQNFFDVWSGLVPLVESYAQTSVASLRQCRKNLFCAYVTMNDPASIKSQIEYGLDGVAEDRTVTVPLKDLLYVYQTLGEMIRFFHQPAHYPTLERIEQFLGNVDSEDAFAALRRCYYDVLRDAWPDDIRAKFNDGDFDNSASPFYYRAADGAGE